MQIIKVLKDIRFVNVGEDPPNPKPGSGWVGRRQWDACVEYNFISAGQAPIYSKPLLNLKVGDVIAAYLTGHGYVGIGIVNEEAIEIKDFKFLNRTLTNLNIDESIINGILINNETVDGLPYLRKTLFCNSNNEKTEYAVRVKWFEGKTVDKNGAYWQKKSGLFANPSIQSNLQGQQKTIDFLENCFNVMFMYQ